MILSGPVVVLFSGGRDSTCLLDLAVRHAGPVSALHVNYGLRGAEADADEAHCAAVCERLGVPLHVHRAGAPAGNVQAWAREVRYAEAERLAAPLGALIATGHTATDQVETVLYRLAASPGRRALLGMPERSGRIVRPLLQMTREQTAAYCVERGLQWREDTSNATSARGRIRATLLPALRDLHPAAEENILRTLATLRDEAAVLDEAVAAALKGSDPLSGVDSRGLTPPALARLVLQRLADEAAGGQAPSIAAHADAILALDAQGTAELDLPGGLRAISEYGRLRIVRGDAAAIPAAVVAARPRARRLRRRRARLRAGRAAADRGRDARRGRARRHARGPAVASRGPDAAARPRRQQVAAGPLHRPQGPA